MPRSQIDELYIRDPYYIAPDGEVGQQAFAVIREAIRKEGMVAIGKVVFTSREHIIALEARDTSKRPPKPRALAMTLTGVVKPIRGALKACARLRIDLESNRAQCAGSAPFGRFKRGRIKL